MMSMGLHMEARPRRPRRDTTPIAEIAKRINAHLRRFAEEPCIYGEYEAAGAAAAGRNVLVTYLSYVPPKSLSRSRARAYLGWLDEGHVGRHYDAERDPDPIIAYRLVHWMGVRERDLAVALTPNRSTAQQLIYELDGPYTSGDIDLKPIRRSERAKLDAVDGSAAEL